MILMCMCGVKRDKGCRPDLVTPRQSKPCCEVMIWGCVTWELLRMWMVISMLSSTRNYLFQHDNAPVHRTRSFIEITLRLKVGQHGARILMLSKICGFWSRGSFRHRRTGSKEDLSWVEQNSKSYTQADSFHWNWL